RVEVLLDQLEVLLGIQSRAAFYPRMNRVGSDDVEFLARGEDEVARVVIDDLDPRIVHHVVILFGEKLRGGRWNQGLHLADDDPLDPRIHHEATRGDAGAESYDQDRFRVGMEQS